METNCKNCDTAIIANFCSNCGQKKYKKIDKKYILDEIQYTFLHANKGLFYSIKKILRSPGKTAKEFIDGNRVNHYKPILLIFVLSGISTFISFKILGMRELMDAYYSEKQLKSNFMEDFMNFISSYNSLFTILLLPFFALSTKIAFKKWGHNYYEHIVMNAYIMSFYTLINILFIYPIMFFFKNSPYITTNISMSMGFIIAPFMLTWFFKEFYEEKPLKTVISRVLAIFGILLLGYILIIIFASIGFLIFRTIQGQEALQYIKPK